MNLDMLIGFIAGLGFYTGIRTTVEYSKKMGVIQLFFTFLAPILTSLWCLKKRSSAFDGSDWDFMVQTAIVDKRIQPWLILILYIITIALIINNCIQLRKKEKKKN